MNRGNFALEGDDEMKRNCCGLRGRGFDDFSREDLRDIILHKNKVIADLEEHAYGSASWIENLNKGIKKANEIKRKVDKKPPKETDEEFKKRLEGFDKDKDAPTEAWGADELDGGGVTVSRPPQRDPPREPPQPPPQVRADGSNVGDILASALTPEQKTIIKNALLRANQLALSQYGWQDRMYPTELDRFVRTFRQYIHPELLPVVDENMPLIRQIANMRPDLRENYIDSIVDDIGRSLNRAISSSGKKTDTVYKQIKGGAAPTPTKPEVSPVAAAAAVLKPVREKIQNGIGDALYGKEDDPKKQRKGLLGISEEGKEESKKKVMKNIVVPIVKTATALGKNVKDIANKIFNPSQYDADMKEERIKEIKRDEAKSGIVRDKENPSIIIRKPRGVWTAETSDPTVEAYNQKRQAVFPRKSPFGEGEKNTKDVFYIRVPNPIFAAKLKPSMKEFSDAGVKLWTGVQQLNPKISEDVDGTLKQLQDDAFIFIPEDNAKEIYAKLRQFVADKQDEEIAPEFADEGWTKGELKRFAKIDPRTLKGQDLIDYKESKLALDRAQTQNALDKVNKDIKDEEAKATPDQARLVKMREGKQRVLKRQQDLVLRGQQEFKDMMMFQSQEKAKRDAEYDARLKADAQGAIDQADADKAEFDAKPIAERIAILESYKAEMGDDPAIDEQIEQLRVEEAEKKGVEQAQGSVDLLQEAEVIGAEGGAKPTNPALYAKAKAIVNKSYPKHSAYRSGAYVKKYKEMGGEYEDEPDGKRPLARWFKEDWKDVGNKEYPVYRPTKRVSKETPLTPEEIDPENLKLQIEEKQKIRGERNLSAFKKRGGAKPVEMKQSDYYKEHKNIVKLLKNTGKSLLSEAKDQQEEATAMAKKLNAPDPFDDAEMLGAGAIEYTLTKVGKPLFNPSGDMSKAGRQSFTPDYDAYGDTVQDGKRNAFNLARSMYDQTKAIELPDFKLIKDDTSLRFYQKMDESVMLVGIRGTDVKSWTDLYTWAVIGANQDLRMTTRFQEDLAKLVAFQRNYPPSQFYYVATGSSLAGSIADRFLELGLIEEAITYNPSIERKYVLEEGILNHRVYLDTDPLFILMGQYAPNTEIRVNPNKTNFYNPSKEKDYLIASHSIYPVYNPAFEGGGMEGSGKTYTLEEWKAIFDAKLEEKRKAIEAREAKKKQTAKAKRERAKARRDARDEPPPLETPFRTSRTMKATPPKEPEPAEEEEPEVEVEEYEMGDEIYLVEMPREGLAFAERRVFDNDGEEIGKLTEDDVGKTLVKMVMRREKIGAFADKPKPSSSESLPFFESQQPKAKEKKERKKKETKAPASARVELREELVAEQPRTEQGKFAEQAETAVVAVNQAPQRAYMKLMKSPIFTDTERKLLTRIRETKMTPRMRAVLLGRSGLARKVMEMLGLDESAFRTQRERARIVDTVEKRVATKATTFILPKEAQDYIDFTVASAEKKVAEMRKSNVAPSKAVGAWYVGEPHTHPNLTKKQIEEWEDNSIRWIGNARKFGLGAIEVVRNAFKEDPLGMWYCGSGVKLEQVKEPPASHTKSRTLQLVCEMTRKQDEGATVRAELDGDAMVFNTTERFPLVKLTQSMLGALREDGVVCRQGVNKGIGRKQSTYWSCEMVGVSEVKRWTETETQRWFMIGRQDILPKLEERISRLEPLFEGATEYAKEKAVKALRPTELKMLVELRAERKKVAEEEARKNSKLLQDAGARLKRYKENYWMTGREDMKGDPFQQQSRKLEHYFIDELGNRVVLGLTWGGLDNHRLNQLWRDFNRMDEATDPDPRNVDYKQMSAARDIMAINPENNQPRLVSIGVERPDGSPFIPASYIHDWVYNSVSLAERGRAGREGYSNWHTGGEKPTNAKEDAFYGAMVLSVRSNMRNASYNNYGLAIYVLPQLVARFSDWTKSKAQRGKWEEEWDANPEEFMKEAFGKAFDLK